MSDDLTRYTVAPKTVMYRGADKDFTWLQVDTTYGPQIQQRIRNLEAHSEMLIERLDQQALDAKKIQTTTKKIAAAEIEMRDHVVAHMLTKHADYFRQNGSEIYSRVSGVSVDIDKADPLVACAMLASEDMLLMMPCEKDETRNITIYRLGAGALLFPNGWALNNHQTDDQPDCTYEEAVDAAKLGKSLSEIHNPNVKHFIDNYTAKAEVGFNHMKPDMYLTRSGWSPKMSDQLLLHANLPVPETPALTPKNWEKHGVLRMEYQTLMKLPQSGAVVFTVKTYNWKFSDVVSNPVARDALIVGFDNLSDQMKEYRAHSLPSFGKALAKYRPT